MAIDLCTEQTYVPPTSIWGSSYTDLQMFYQHYFAEKRASGISWGVHESLSEPEKDDLYQRLLYSVGMVDSDFLFDSLLRSRIKDIRVMGLSDNTLTYNRKKGFSNIYESRSNAASKNQHKITAISNRIRDAFGHGRFSTKNGFVLIEDKRKDITGRIILMPNDLIVWKGEIESFLTEHDFSIPCV